jgi:hypothetical protein
MYLSIYRNTHKHANGLGRSLLNDVVIAAFPPRHPSEGWDLILQKL